MSSIGGSEAGQYVRALLYNMTNPKKTGLREQLDWKVAASDLSHDPLADRLQVLCGHNVINWSRSGSRQTVGNRPHCFATGSMEGSRYRMWRAECTGIHPFGMHGSALVDQHQRYDQRWSHQAHALGRHDKAVQYRSVQSDNRATQGHM